MNVLWCLYSNGLFTTIEPMYYMFLKEILMKVITTLDYKAIVESMADMIIITDNDVLSPMFLLNGRGF